MPFLRFFLVLLPFCGLAQESFIDERDGQIYPLVRIGEQVWMQENMRYALPGATALPPEVPQNYGYLYNWQAALKACPSGWKLPSDEDWKTLERFLGMSEEELHLRFKYRGADTAISTQLAAPGHWKGYDAYAPRYGKSGFNALPAGVATRKLGQGIFGLDDILKAQLDTFPPPASQMNYEFIGSQTGFWSSTLDTVRVTRSSPFVRSIEQKYIDVYRFPSGQHVYYSCRCLREERGD